jgi:hypothetical protein
MVTGTPGGGGAARDRQRGSARSGACDGQLPNAAGGGMPESALPSAFVGWAFATTLCSKSQKLMQD